MAGLSSGTAIPHWLASGHWWERWPGPSLVVSHVNLVGLAVTMPSGITIMLQSALCPEDLLKAVKGSPAHILHKTILVEIGSSMSVQMQHYESEQFASVIMGATGCWVPESPWGSNC